MLDSPTNKIGDSKAWFFFVLVYLIVDYARPQDVLPISALRPGMIVILTLFFFILKNNALTLIKADQVRIIWYFILLLAIYIPFARNNFFAYKTFTTILFFMPFILSVILCVNNMDRLKLFMQIYIGIMVYVAIYSLLHNGVGSGAYFSDENDIALYVNMVIPFCYFLFKAEKKKKLKIVYAIGLIVGVFAVVVSFSRGGFLGLVAVFFVIWLVRPRKILSLLVIAVLAGAVYFTSDDQYKQEMSTSTDTSDSTANARLMSWASAWDMFLDKPWGVGGNNFQVHFSDYQGDRFNRGMWGRVAHSLWFTLIPELGIIGIILYYKLFRFNFREILSLKVKKRQLTEDEEYLNALSIAFIAAFAGFFVSATFLSVLYYPHYWYLTAIIVAAARIKANMDEKKSKQSDELQKN